MIAETIMGNGEYAFEYYNQINPAKKNDIIDEYECEPYVYPQNILGDEHSQFGLGKKFLAVRYLVMDISGCNKVYSWICRNLMA